MQIAKAGTLREKLASGFGFKRGQSQHRRLPLALIAMAMLGYVFIVWQWL